MENHGINARICAQYSTRKAVGWRAYIKEKLKLWQHNYQTRKQLTGLDSRQLSDIGISRSEALEEARKPFWEC